MFEDVTKSIDWGGKPLSLNTGLIARQADGAVMVNLGETAVLCTSVAQRTQAKGVDFFPLGVFYQERAYAAGKIPGGFFKREARPTEKETLTSRLIDRPIRPLFASNFRNETQIICTVVSHDLQNNPDIAALIGASAALTISGVPFMGPIAACRVGYRDGEFLFNPTKDEMADSQLDLIVAGTREGVLMVESEAHELSEEVMLRAVMAGHNHYQSVIDLIISLAEESAKEPWDEIPVDPTLAAVSTRVRDAGEAKLREAYGIIKKQDRQTRLAELRSSIAGQLEDDDTSTDVISKQIKSVEKDIVRNQILDSGQRIDGRKTDEIRPIDCRVGILKRAHGSALFTRGETQALVVTTLGTGQDEQIMDSLDGEYRQHFMLHYNFPPYSVGETGRMMGPGRREIGHGKLAWRSINPLLPAKEDFPYTMRAVSEITESNGSSSMATVCGTSLALMDAGAPLKSPCAGIAMGLIKEDDGRFAVLSDILGDEDHLGDMDFKVAGTQDGITALQMDIKITSITEEIMRQALAQAADGRKHILGIMASAINQGRTELSDHAPRIETINIPRDKIRDIIGTGGKIIREICETTGAKIDIEDDGTIKVSGVDGKSITDALNWINGIVADAEVGTIYHGKVVRIMDFGAFVNFMGSRDGLVHISELAEGRTDKVTDVVNEGDEVYVKCLEIDPRGKVRLSMRCVDQQSGEELDVEPNERAPRRENSDRKPRRRD